MITKEKVVKTCRRVSCGGSYGTSGEVVGLLMSAPAQLHLSTLLPHDVHPEESPKPCRSESAKLYAAQAAGVQAKHVTEGILASTSPPSGIAWSEHAGYAGSPTCVHAQLEVDGQRHFFGERMWPSRQGCQSPHNPRALSQHGETARRGHFAQGQQHLEEATDLTPRGETNGRLHGVSQEQHHGRASVAKGSMAWTAQRIFFDGSQARALISGDSCLD